MMQTQEVTVNDLRADLVRFFNRLGETVLRNAWYPPVAIGIAQAMVIPEAGLLDCLATAAGLLLFTSTAAVFCFAVGWGMSLGRDD